MKSRCPECQCRYCDSIKAECDIPCLSQLGCDAPVTSCPNYTEGDSHE